MFLFNILNKFQLFDYIQYCSKKNHLLCRKWHAVSLTLFFFRCCFYISTFGALGPKRLKLRYKFFDLVWKIINVLINLHINNNETICCVLAVRITAKKWKRLKKTIEFRCFCLSKENWILENQCKSGKYWFAFKFFRENYANVLFSWITIFS